MGHQKKRPSLDPVLENSIGPPITFTRQVSTQYKPHKYGSRSKVEPQCACMSPLSFLVKLRDRYIKAMNEMAVGGDFTAVTGFHGWAEFNYTLEHCKSVKDRHTETLQAEMTAAITRSKSQARQL